MQKDFYSKYVGEVFYRLTIKDVIRNPKPKFICECSCGGSITTDVYSVLHKKTKSCGCLRKEKREDGKKNLKPSVSIGQQFKNKQGRVFEVISYEKSSNVLVRFIESDYEKWSAVKEIKKGSIRDRISDPMVCKEKVNREPRPRKPAVSIGDVYKNYYNCSYKVIELLEDNLCRIKFLDEFGFEKIVPRGDAKRGVRNPYRRIASGVGFMGDGYYAPENSKRIFSLWDNMFTRCYAPESFWKQPTYKDCSVCEEWHKFQNFAKWCEVRQDFKNDDWCLDKDIIEKGNKVYSPNKCCFVPRCINNLFTLRGNERGEYPLGVHRRKDGRLVAQVNIEGKRVCLGRFPSVESAFNAYKNAKEEVIKRFAEEYRGSIAKEAFDALINWKVEITD